LGERGHEVLVLAPSLGRAPSVSEAGFSLRIVGRALPVPANGSVAPISFGPRAARAVDREVAAFSPDVMHLHEPLVPSTSMLALRTGAAPSVGTFHAATDSSLGYRLGRPLLESLVGRLAVRTTVSQAARDLVSTHFPGEYVMTPNGVDVARFQNAARSDRSDRHKKTVLFLSRIERRKGLQVLIQALASQRDLDARLVVAGSGPQERACRKLAEELLVDAAFVSGLSDEEVATTYADAEVFCAPGLGGESFGIVLLEAMAAGTPVVCSDLPAFRAVAGDSALYAATGNPASLAAAVRKVLRDEQTSKRLREAGAATAARYDWDRLVGGVELAYGIATKAVTT
jgi:phosphatidylinositol alpha-mannosyltransferase